ncbi:dihydroorotase [Mycoplasma todarodis]|uniref:dihydroorotase n=1 Tax=Mycoplasma todarodis TaxID=1937191 RepID=UPI003B2D0DED
MKYINGIIYYKGELVKKDFAVVNKRIVFDGLEDMQDTKDLKNKTVSPGFVDVHIHTRVPGFEYKEDLDHIENAMLHGGFTHAIAQSNTNPKPDNLETLKDIQELLDEKRVNIIQAARITKDDKVVDIGKMSESTRLFTDDGFPVKKEETMLDAIKLAKTTDSTLILHEEDSEIKGEMYHCSLSDKENIKSFDEDYESNIVERDIRLNKGINANIHMQHISTEKSIKAIAKAREGGMNITAELTPHHMSLDNEMIINDGKFKMNPPLSKPETRQALIKALKDEVITIIATDHAPHSVEEKSGGFQKSVNGIIGLETSFAVVNTIAQKNQIPLKTIINAMSINPGKLMGVNMEIEEGSIANLTILDVDKKWVFKPENIKSKSKNTPFLNMELIGKVESIILNGEYIELKEKN